jgi:hypothetical protein
MYDSRQFTMAEIARLVRRYLHDYLPPPYQDRHAVTSFGDQAVPAWRSARESKKLLSTFFAWAGSCSS